MSDWKVLTNHGAALMLIAAKHQLTALEIAHRLGIVERTVRRILADLETDGYIVKTKESRTNAYSINETMPLRHEEFRDVTIGKIIDTVLQCLADGKLAEGEDR